MIRATTREEAVNLRREGFSYNFIRDRLKVPKSTLSRWLRDVPFLPNNEFAERVNRSHSLLKDLRRQAKTKSENEAKRLAVGDVGSLSKRDLFMLGLGIYMGEGARTAGLRLVSSDPGILKVGVAWFKKFYGIPKEHFMIRIHLGTSGDVERSREYWSKTLDFDLEQFYPELMAKGHNEPKRHSGRAVFGTAHITIKRGKRREFGVLLHRRVLQSIEIAKNLAALV